MAKKTIKERGWYDKCLKDSKRYEAEKKAELDRLNREYHRLVFQNERSEQWLRDNSDDRLYYEDWSKL